MSAQTAAEASVASAFPFNGLPDKISGLCFGEEEEKPKPKQARAVAAQNTQKKHHSTNCHKDEIFPSSKRQKMKMQLQVLFNSRYFETAIGRKPIAP